MKVLKIKPFSAGKDKYVNRLFFERRKYLVNQGFRPLASADFFPGEDKIPDFNSVQK
jgi:hypothetical protein